MKRLRSIVMATLAVVVAVIYGAPSVPVSAASSSALSIVPKKNYIIEPGKSVKDTLVIRNLDAASPLELSLRVIDFTYTDDGGTPKLFFDENAPQTTWSLKPFMSVPQSVTIPPSSSKTLNMNVSIPAGHGAGSYYSAIVYSSGSGSSGAINNVGLSASGVTLVFVSIPGKVTEDLKLEKFGPYTEATPQKPAAYMPFITLQEPDQFAYTLKNGGNVTEAPVGSITLNDMYGRKYVINDVNPSQSLALIGQTRTFITCIKKQAQDVDFQGARTTTNKCVPAGLWPGMYTASIDLFYGQNGNVTKEVTGTMIFFYLPWWFILAVLLVVAIATYYIRKFVRYVREKMNGGVKLNKRSSHRRK